MSLVSESVLAAADALLVPVVPTVLALRTLDQVLELAGGHRALQVLPFLSMVDRRKREHREVCERVAAGEGGFLSAAIPAAALVERMGQERAPVTVTAPSSPAALAFAQLWREVAARLGLGASWGGSGPGPGRRRSAATSRARGRGARSRPPGRGRAGVGPMTAMSDRAEEA